MAMTLESLGDFAELTINKIPRGKSIDEAQKYQHLISTRILESKKKAGASGPRFQWPVKVRVNDSATQTGPFQVASVSVLDLMETASVPWRQQTNAWAYDLMEEAFQGTPEKIKDILVVRDEDCRGQLLELHERNFWTSPSSPSDNRPNGVPYWFPKDVTVPAGHFSAVLPSGHTTIAGISPVTVEGHRHWAAGYNSVTINDLVEKLKVAQYKTHFTPYVPFQELTMATGRTSPETFMGCGLYSIFDVCSQLDVLRDSRNENIKDLVTHKALIGSIHIEPVPYLDENDAEDAPVYGFNFRYFGPQYNAKIDMQRKMVQQPQAPTVTHVHYYDSVQWTNLDRRKGGFVISKQAT